MSIKEHLDENILRDGFPGFYGSCSREPVQRKISGSTFFYNGMEQFGEKASTFL